MLKWTSKGSLNSEEVVSNPAPHDLSWHKPRDSDARLIDPGRRSLAEPAEQRRLQAFLSAEPGVVDGLKRKRSLASEPNSLHCSREDVRHFRSLSLPSSPQVKKKNRYGVFKKLKNIFRKGKWGSSDTMTQDYVLSGPGSNNKEQKGKEDKKGAKGKKGAPMTRLTRLIESKRGQRKASMAEDTRYMLGESPSFLTPSTSSDEEGYAAFLRNQVSDGHLGTFAAPSLHTFPSAGDQTSKAARSKDRSVNSGFMPVGISNVDVRRMVEEPKVIARFVRAFDNEIEFPPIDLKSPNREVKCDDVGGVEPVKVESFILDGSRYELVNSPVHSSQLSTFDKYVGQDGLNGIRKLRQRSYEDYEDDSRSTRPYESSETVRELTRSLSLIRESGSLEKVKVMFSSSESIVQARSLLCPPTSDRQSPRSKLTPSPNSVRVDTIALHGDNGDQWSSQDEDQTMFFPSQSSSMNDFFYKDAGDAHDEYSHQNPLCTRNNNNGHHNSPLVSTTTLYDLAPDVNETFFKPSYALKPDTSVDAYTSKRTEMNYSDISFVSSPPLSPFGKKSRADDARRVINDCRSDSDTKCSSLDTVHQSLLSIQPKRVKDIVDQIERESLSSIPRFSPIERASDKRLREVESVRQTENNNKISNEETAQATTQETRCAAIKERLLYENVGSAGVQLAADKEKKSIGDNCSFAIDGDSYSRSDVAEKDFTSPGSFSFHMSEQMADDQNTYVSDTNAFYSDNSDALTSSSFSKDGEDPGRATKFAPVVHLVCNSLMNSFSFDTKSEQDFQEAQQSGRGHSSDDFVKSQNAENHTPLTTSAQVAYCSVDDDDERNYCCAQEQKSIERDQSGTDEDIIEMLTESSPERNNFQEHGEETNLVLCEFQNIKIENYMVSVQERNERAEMDTGTGSEQEGITDVIAPKLMIVLDSSLQDNVSDTLENKSIASDANVSQFSNSNFEHPGAEDTKRDNKSLSENIELKEATVVSPVVNSGVFYMPDCALEEFNLATIDCSNYKEIKLKKKVSFNLDVNSPEESSVSDDRALLETTLPKRHSSGSFIGHSTGSEVKESESSTDVSITDLSNKQSEIIVGLTPPGVTSTSGDDFSWWGGENIEDIDFLHDESFSIDEGQVQLQDTNVAASSATENLLQGDFSAMEFALPENCLEEDVCGTSNILTLSSFLTSGSLFNKNEVDKQSLFLTVDDVQIKGPEIPNDISQATFDEKSLLQSDVYQGDRIINKQNEAEEYADEMLRNEDDYGLTEEQSYQEQEEEEVEVELEVDQASDINTHTYNVFKDTIEEEKKTQAWWESHSAASATNFSFGSFEIDSQDESNTLSELYNQVKSSKLSNKKQTLVPVVMNISKEKAKQKSTENVSHLLKSKANIKFKKGIASTEFEQHLTNPESRSSGNNFKMASENNVDKLLKSGKVSVIPATNYLDKNDADREELSGQMQSTGTVRLNVSRGTLQLKTNIENDTDASIISYSGKTFACQRPKQNKPIEDDDDDDDKIRSPIKNAKRWGKSPNESASVSSEGTSTSDDDFQVDSYCGDSPYFTDNVKGFTGSAASYDETTQDSMSSSSQCLTDSCVIDNFADYVSVSSQNISETSFERAGSTVTGYTESNQRNVQWPMYDNQSVNAALKLSQTNKNITKNHYQPMDFKYYHEATNAEACNCLNKRMDQKAAPKLVPQKEPNKSEYSMELRSGKSLTLAVAESDTTATTDLLSLDVFSISQSRPVGNGQDFKAKIILENSDVSAGKQVFYMQQSAATGGTVGQSTAGRHQQPGDRSYNDHDGQGQQKQPPRQQRHNDSQQQRSRFTSRREGSAKSRPSDEQSSPGSPCNACPQWRKHETRAQSRPGEWLFIASFFIFQLFMHWVYA